MKPLLLLTVLGSVATGWVWAQTESLRAPLPPTAQILLPHPPPFWEESEPDPPAEGREAAEGLPVPIYPGTRVTEAEIRPPTPAPAPVARRRRAPVVPPAMPPTTTPGPQALHPVSGRLSATEERARDDARRELLREVAEWLAPEVPSTWTPSNAWIDPLVRSTETRSVRRDYGTLYEATLGVDFSPQRRDELIAAYRRDLVAHRLEILGGGFGFILFCLASLAGYIRADEATRGYYTKMLRTATLAGVGAAGALIYQWLA